MGRDNLDASFSFRRVAIAVNRKRKGKEERDLAPFWVLCSVYDASQSFLHTPQSSVIRNSSSRGKKKKGFHKHMKTLTASRERLGLKLSWKVPSRWAALSKGSLGMSASGGVELLCFQYQAKVSPHSHLLRWLFMNQQAGFKAHTAPAKFPQIPVDQSIEHLQMLLTSRNGFQTA